MMGHDQGENWDQGYKAWEKAQKEKEKTQINKIIVKNPPGINIEELKKLMNQPLKIMVSEPFEIEHLDIDYLKHELEAAAAYISENEVIHKKMKKDIPTVIEYQGRRYVLDMQGGKAHV